MSEYIKEKKFRSHTWLAWLSVGMLVANVYHNKLLAILFPFFSSQLAVIMLIGSVFLFVFYFFLDGHVRLSDLRFTEIDYAFLLAAVVILATSGGDSENLTYFVRFFSLFVFMLFMKYDEKMIKIVFICLLIAGIIHVAATLFFYFDQDFYLKYIYPTFSADEQEKLYSWNIVNGYATGFAGHFSRNGIYTSVALLVSSLLLYTKNKNHRILFAVLTLVSLIALIMTSKRAPLVFAVFAIAATYILCARTTPLSKLGIIALAVIGSAVIIYIASFNIESIGVSFERFLSTFNKSDTNDVSNGRFKLYGVAWDYFLSAPIFGIGWREFSKRVVVFFNEDTYFRDTHNVFLQLLCETGIVGIIIFLCLFALVLFLSVRLLIKVKRGELQISETARFGLIFSITAQIFFLSYSMTENPLYDLETFYLYAFAIGFVSTVWFRYEKLPIIEKIRSEKEKSIYIK